MDIFEALYRTALYKHVPHSSCFISVDVYPIPTYSVTEGNEQLPLIGGFALLTCVVRTPKDICWFSLVKDLLR